jgi:hypothetical protein
LFASDQLLVEPLPPFHVRVAAKEFHRQTSTRMTVVRTAGERPRPLPHPDRTVPTWTISVTRRESERLPIEIGIRPFLLWGQ